MISLQPLTPNQLLLNPKSPIEEKNVLLELKHKFELQFADKDFFLIPSSGSSKNESESVKLIAISLQAILNSAARFNDYFKVEATPVWGLVLPTFHVAGLAILARAHLAKAQVVSINWIPEKMQSWLDMHAVTFLSLVPAQVYDLVQLK